MKVYCPYCGNSEATPFSDSVYKNHGFECDSCHKDFGVDDGKTFVEHENNLGEFYFRYTEKDGSSLSVDIKKEAGKVYLYPYNLSLFPEDKIIGTNAFPKLFPVLKNIFSSLFEE